MDVLEPSGDPEGGGSDALTGQRKSRLKSLKSRLFGKIRRKDGDVGVKSQSESDIILGVEVSEHDFCSKGMLGSRALSHDSVFLAENTHEPPRLLPHENIHGNIRAVQMKLQQQKMHLGPPPLLLSSKRHEDLGGSAEDDDLPRLSRSISNKPLSPQLISPASLPISPSALSPGVDFSTPPQFTSLLDNSAARHRMSIKPKNQRASGKNKKTVTSAESRPRSESLNNLEHSLTKTVEEPIAKEAPCVRSYSSKVLRLGERQTALQSKSTPTVLSSLSLQGAEETRQVSGENEDKNLLSTSPQNSGLKELTPAEVPVSTIKQEAAKVTKILSRSYESQAAKPQSPGVLIDRTMKQELNDSKLLKNSQSNLVSTLRAHVDTIQEPSIMQDEKSNNDQMDTLSKCGVQTVVNVEIQHSYPQAPVNVITRVNLRPSSLRRNAPSADESKTPQSVTTVSPSAQEQHSQTESMKRPRSISATFQLAPSSDKIQERPRTASFTGVVGQDGLKKDPPYPSKHSLTFKTQGQLSSQAEKTKKDPHCSIPPQSQKEEKAQVIPPKFIDLAKYSSRTQDVGENKDNGMQELGVEATEEEIQEGVEEAEEAGEDVTDVKEANERGATNSFGVKLRSTSLSLKFRLDKAQSEIKVKQHSAEVSTLSPPLALRSDSTSHVESEDHRSSMGSKLKNPLLQAKESSNPSCTLKSVSKDKEMTGFSRQAESPQPSLLPSKATKIAPLLPKEGADLLPKEPTAVTSQENAPTSTASEMSWMEMAREKTRSLQQLFTSRLPDFPGFQTTTRPTTLNTTQPLPQTSTSQASARTTQNITNQPTATNLSLRPTDIPTRHLPSVKPFGRSTQPVQTHISTTTQPLALPTCTIQTNTSQSQVDCIEELPFQSKPQMCSSTTKTTQSTVTCTSNMQSTTHTIYTVKQLSSQPQSPPIQQSLPLHTGPIQASQTSTQSLLHPTPSPAYQYLSSSPKKTSHLMPQQSVKTVSKDQPQNEGFEPQTPPIQQSSPLQAGPLQASQTSTQSLLRPKSSSAYPILSSSPKKTSHLMPQQSVKTVSKDQPQNEGFEHETLPIQQSSPLQAGPLQASQTSTQSVLHPKPSTAYPYLSSSPQKTSHLISQQSTNTVPKDQPQNEGFEPSITSGKADRVSMPRGKGNRLEDIKPLWATGLGNKTQLVQHWENQSTAATKAGEQKDTTESQVTAPYTAPVSKVSATDTGTDPKASVPCVTMRTGDREDKWQKKLVPPSSSPSSSSPLQSVQDSDQPSWMELAKRKSLAWSDKTMD